MMLSTCFTRFGLALTVTLLLSGCASTEKQMLEKETDFSVEVNAPYHSLGKCLTEKLVDSHSFTHTIRAKNRFVDGKRYYDETYVEGDIHTKEDLEKKAFYIFFDGGRPIFYKGQSKLWPSWAVVVQDMPNASPKTRVEIRRDKTFIKLWPYLHTDVLEDHLKECLHPDPNWIGF